MKRMIKIIMIQNPVFAKVIFSHLSSTYPCVLSYALVFHKCRVRKKAFRICKIFSLDYFDQDVNV